MLYVLPLCLPVVAGLSEIRSLRFSVHVKMSHLHNQVFPFVCFDINHNAMRYLDTMTHTMSTDNLHAFGDFGDDENFFWFRLRRQLMEKKSHWDSDWVVCTLRDEFLLSFDGAT